MKIQNIRGLVQQLDDSIQRPGFKTMDAAIKKAAKRGVAVHSDGRCYIPESKRGKGVGYGTHG